MDGKVLCEEDTISTRTIHCLPSVEARQEHILCFKGNFNTVRGLYLEEFDEKAYQEEIQLLKAKDLKNIVQEGNHIQADFVAEEGEQLMLTLPAEDGYRVLIDGVEQEWKTLMKK